ncbi:hypothetical protein L228DRAFT_270180 [Xylona heveae TC161]|uniref:Rab proteins geranylgeranyltransferase n=1 Tax=Xylona heveae (strain CBS 132557 / TC161) TaxID=1328760 RepID=A0A165FFG4_XYLHT|nr:hypothetical protein L228DRAFT_270180 [Xylona heveae TC161]KZF20915.1 hypothetical protein L228DRAFT_270180 [Xylona heveae TC161]
MDSLSGTFWDVVIAGTGLQQSLLALSLSRSGKKVLHADKNRYYGGFEAAFTLQEAEEWLNKGDEDSPLRPFRKASSVPQASLDGSNKAPKLSARAYSLALSPQLLYARSSLLQALISSKVYRQLEFLAVGSWWIYVPRDRSETGEALTSSHGELKKVPNGREDIFSDDLIDLRSKRSLMKFLKFVADYENMSEVWSDYASIPFSEFLRSRFGISMSLQAPLLALTLSPVSPSETPTSFALPRIARHLRSMGVFGPGFGAVLPKWGGGAEIAQVACRACAVGGGVYVLDEGISDVSNAPADQGEMPGQVGSSAHHPVAVTLSSGETVNTLWLVGSPDDIPKKSGTTRSGNEPESPTREEVTSKSISIVSSPLTGLFPQTAEAGPVPAGAVVVFPPETLLTEEKVAENQPPVYIMVHSSDSGECPSGQCILYSSVFISGDEGQATLDLAVNRLLSSLGEDPKSCLLWSMRYSQQGPSLHSGVVSSCEERSPGQIFFPRSSNGLAFDDELLNNVKCAYEKIVGSDNEDSSFMAFSDREVPTSYMSDEE